jgi:hypothetical protein
VIDAQVAHLIERQIVRDGRSLVQYVEEAFLYSSASGEELRHRVDALAKDEQQAVGKLIRFLHKEHVTPPLLGAFPSRFTTINFAALDHLLPAILKEQEAGIAELERALHHLPECEGRHVLWEYLEGKRRRLGALRGDGTEPAAPAASGHAAH